MGEPPSKQTTAGTRRPAAQSTIDPSAHHVFSIAEAVVRTQEAGEFDWVLPKIEQDDSYHG
jgi:hypothetical protein